MDGALTEHDDPAGVDAFARFVRDVEPRLRRALIAFRGVDGAGDAVAEALAYAWEHWDRVQTMTNPAGYLFRVGQSRTRPRRQPLALPPVDPMHMPEVEPALPEALAALTEKQRGAVWLVHACGWTYAETSEALGVSVTAVGTHVARALERLRSALAVEVLPDA